MAGRPGRFILFPPEVKKPRGVARASDIRDMVPGKALIKMLSEVALGKVKKDGKEDWAYGVKERLDAAKILLPKILPDLKAMQLDITANNGQALSYEMLAAAAKFIDAEFGEQLHEPQEGMRELEAPVEAITADS